MSAHPFIDRREAGRYLAAQLLRTRRSGSGTRPLLVLGLPRGGVPVAHEVAVALNAPLDVLPVRKIGYPGNPEYAVGALATLDDEVVRVMDEAVWRGEPAAGSPLAEVIDSETRELQRRRRLYRQDRPPLPVASHDLVLVDDGLATGATMRAAVKAARLAGARHITVAAPVGSSSACARLREDADACVCAIEVPNLLAIGMWYRNFEPTPDAEVLALLADAGRRRVAAAPP